MKRLLAFSFLLVFALGWLVNSAYSEIKYSGLEVPLEIFNNSERLSSGDHISTEKIWIYDDYAILNIPGLSLARYEDTNSMDPILDSEANGLEVRPREEDLELGDVVAYRSNKVDGLIVHRIVGKSIDEYGETYYILKGDNNSKVDSERVYLNNDEEKAQIEYLLVGVVW